MGRSLLQNFARTAARMELANDLNIGNCSSFPNNICASVTSHPDLMYSSGVHVNSGAPGKGLFRGRCVFRIRDRELASSDQMRCQTSMRMRWIVGITEHVSLLGSFHKSRLNPRPVTPSEDMIEPPFADCRFRILKFCHRSIHGVFQYRVD